MIALAGMRIDDNRVGNGRAPRQQPGQAGRALHLGATHVPHEACGRAQLLRDHPEQVGMVEPGLQYVGAKLAQCPEEPQNATRVRCAPAQAERADRDALGFDQRPHSAWPGHADHHRTKAVAVGAAGDVGQHPFGTPDLKPGDQVQDGNHLCPTRSH
jgi:hypothetical protein